MPGPSPHDDPNTPAANGPAASSTHPWGRLDDLYTVRPPWDIGHPQPVFQELARSGAIRGRVLDIGCGTGEHTLMCAGLGLDATGLDLADTALQAAEDKARQRGAAARFLHHDALRLAELGEQFDTVLDCGLFHMLDIEDRAAFTAGLQSTLAPGGRYFLLCFSDREPSVPGAVGPHRLTRDDINATFSDRLRIDSIVPATIEITIPDRPPIQGWSVAMTKVTA